MIPKSQIRIGARIVENDPEEQVPVPYKGKVIAIKETGKRGDGLLCPHPVG